MILKAIFLLICLVPVLLAVEKCPSPQKTPLNKEDRSKSTAGRLDAVLGGKIALWENFLSPTASTQQFLTFSTALTCSPLILIVCFAALMFCWGPLFHPEFFYANVQKANKKRIRNVVSSNISIRKDIAVAPPPERPTNVKNNGPMAPDKKMPMPPGPGQNPW